MVTRNTTCERHRTEFSRGGRNDVGKTTVDRRTPVFRLLWVRTTVSDRKDETPRDDVTETLEESVD